MNLFNPPKYAHGDLLGQNANALALLDYFKQQAKKTQWQDTEIQQVTEQATQGDYNHLLRVLNSHVSTNPLHFLSKSFTDVIPDAKKAELDMWVETQAKTLIPEFGQADTKHGELLRAISDIRYSWFTNGNHFLLKGESANSSAEWIFQNSNETIQNLISSFASAETDDEDLYSNFTYLLTEHIRVLIENTENEPNTEDSYECEGRWEYVLCDDCSDLVSPSQLRIDHCGIGYCYSCHTNQAHDYS